VLGINITEEEDLRKEILKHVLIRYLLITWLCSNRVEVEKVLGIPGEKIVSKMVHKNKSN
jgi:hypothetical protein